MDNLDLLREKLLEWPVSGRGIPRLFKRAWAVRADTNETSRMALIHFNHRDINDPIEKVFTHVQTLDRDIRLKDIARVPGTV